MVEFTDEAIVPAPPDQAFDLALSIDAHKGAFASSREQAVSGITTGIIGMGEFVTWKARHFGITWTMTSRITEWDRPRRFVDEQQRGPFKSFRHEHVFEPMGDNATRMNDHVWFEAPLGVLGRAVERLVLARYLRHLIHVRNQFLVTEAARQS